MQAKYHSELLLDSRHLDGVRVIEEEIDPDTDEVTSTIVIQRIKKDEKSRQRAAPTNKRRKTSAKARKGAARRGKGQQGKKKKRDTFGRYFVRVSIIFLCCGIGFILLSAYIMTL